MPPPPVSNFLIKKNVNSTKDRKIIVYTFNQKYKTQYKSCEEITRKEKFPLFASVVETLFLQGVFIKNKYSFTQKRVKAVDDLQRNTI